MTRNLPMDTIGQEYTDGMTLTELGDKYSVSRGTIWNRLIKSGMQMHEPPYRRRHACSQDFFDDLTNELTAYWLGFIFTDGTLARGRTRFTICLHPRDHKHLERFKSDIGFAGPVYSYKDYSVVSISNKHIYNRLLSLGVVPNKSLVARFPIIPSVSMRHFLRGCIDGDGSIGISNNKYGYGVVRFYSGSYDFINSFRQAVCLSSTEIHIRPIRKNKSCFEISWRSRNDVSKICQLLYGDCAVSLERKRQLALLLI